jgi:hypothetical protein
MTKFEPEMVELLRLAAKKLKGHARRVFMAEVALRLCDGNARQAEVHFGWGRATVQKGLEELRTGVPIPSKHLTRVRARFETSNIKFANDLREIVEPKTQADPELKSERRYLNLSATEVLQALVEEKGWRAEDLPAPRTMRRILNRMNYRLKPIRKSKPLKKTPECDAIFANVQAVKQASRGDPETLEISADTKAKVAIGDFSRGGKKPHRQRRQTSASARS